MKAQINRSIAFFQMRKSSIRWILIYIFVFIVFRMLSMLINMSDSMNTRAATEKGHKNIKKNWHDYKTMYLDIRRVGIGEQGKAATLYDTNLELEKKSSLENGFNALLSDTISVNRSLPDIRNKACYHKQYLKQLPQVSIVMPFYNEHLSVLMRSLHSIINRSPPELLKEIILVDDFSDRANLFKPLENYIAVHFTKVKILRMSERSGLIRARMAGMRNATGEVLIVFDSHIETNYNWLPPLIEPIALNKRSVVCPLVDIISHRNFEYRAQHEGSRGGFDWTFRYVRTSILPEDLVNRTEPYRNPVMSGGLFAISAEFFWEIGGYDEGLEVWGGEQYELSLKIWMCGGQLFDAPCSRVGHIFRGPWNARPNSQKNKNYIARNFKRVAEVWLDEYKKYVYERGNGAYDLVDPGDLTAQKALREKLKCKSFKWYMENVAFDIFKEYPPIEPPEYAYGAIQNVAFPNLCVDTLNKPRNQKVGLSYCANDLKNPQQQNQNFSLNYRRDIRLRQGRPMCLDVREFTQNAPVRTWECHGQGGNQFWYYDRVNKWIIHGKNGKRCLEASAKSLELSVNTCDKKNILMKWNFGVINITALNEFYNNI